MSVAILGPGNMGLGIAKLLVAKGHPVVLGDRDPAKAAAKAAELGQHATAADFAGASAQADIVILAVPFGAVEEAIGAAGGLSGKVLVDITNPLSADHMELTIGHMTSAAEEVAKLAPGAKVVKAFNTILWQVLPFEVRNGKPPLQVLLASDDAGAKATVSDLVTSLGFEAVDAGPLKNARHLEPVAELTIHLGYVLGMGTGIAPTWVRLS